MTNPIASAQTAQATTIAGIVGNNAPTDLSSAGSTFVDFLMTHLGAMNMSEADLSAITQDLSDGQISTDSPIFNILNQITEQFNIEQNNSTLSAGNELFLQELAGLFVDLNKDGDITLSTTTVNHLEKISTGEVPAEEFVALIQDTGLFIELREAIRNQRATGLAKTAIEPEDIFDIADKKSKGIFEKDGKKNNVSDDVVAVEATHIIEDIESDNTSPVDIVLKRLNSLLERIEERIASATSPRSKQSLEKVAEHISGLIVRFESKVANAAGSFADVTETIAQTDNIIGNNDGDINIDALASTPTRHALLKGATGDKAGTQQAVQSGQVASGAALSGKTTATNGTATGSFTLNASGDFAPVDDGDVFNTPLDVKSVVADGIQNTMKSTSTAAQNSARMLLPPSPAAQQVMIHVQKNANSQSKMNIQLHPSELGRVDVHLTIGKDGRTTAVVMADRPETLQLLQKDSAHLEKALQNAGLDVGAQDLSFNLRDDAQNSFKSRRRFGKNTTDKTLPVEGMQLNGTQIDAAVFDRYSVNYKA